MGIILVTPTDYIANTPLPAFARWPHQIEAFTKFADVPVMFLSAEQRTGKTQIIIDKIGYLYETGKISAALIAAMPSGAPRNWIDEIAANLPTRITRKIHLWEAKRVKSKAAQDALAEMMKDTSHLHIIVINGEATITDPFADYIGPWLKAQRKRRGVFIVADESTLIMRAPGIKRAKVMKQLRKYCSYAACLDGTPTGEGPLDLFSQYNFLDQNILGYTSFMAFKMRYAVLEDGFNHNTNTAYKTIKRDEAGDPIYQNINELQRNIAPHTFRVLFRDVFKDVPQPVYQKRYVELTTKQREVYDRLETEYEAELKVLGTVTVANVLTRYLRLQQITSGFWPSDRSAVLCHECDGNGCQACDDLGVVERDIPLQRIIPFEDNPRLCALREELGFTTKPAVIWCRFNQDIDDVMTLCRQVGRIPVQYDGRIPPDLKYENKATFQGGGADTFVAKTRSAGRAVSVSRAELMYYYSSEFGLNQRLQSEVRAETGTRVIATQIVDFVAPGTKDEIILASHRSRRKLSDMILNEQSGKWL